MNELKIIKLTWDKIYLKLEFDGELTDKLYLVCGKEKYQICDEYIEKNSVCMPITCAYDDTMIKEGKWNFLYKDNIVQIDIEESKTLENKEKVYFYKKRDYAYIVSFAIGEEFELIMYVSYMKKNLNPYRNDRVTTKRVFLHSLTTTFIHTVLLLAKFEYNFFCLFKSKKKKKILFMSETRDEMQGNLLALNKRMIEKNLDKEYKFYYSFKKVLSDKKSIIYYLKTIALLAKVHYIFIDDYAPIFNLVKLKDTKLIQLWHAGVGFKSVGYSRFGKSGSPHPLVSPHRAYDYAVVASPNLIKTYQEVFGLTKKHFLAPGMLRLDGYLDEDTIKNAKEKIYDKYPMLKDKQVILFAPTYRGADQPSAYYDFSKIDMEKLYDTCKKNKYITIFKFHPFIKEKIKIDEKYKDYLIDVSDYPDINELFYITDILITDYSSNIYEFSLFSKPIIFFDYDLEKYAILRGVHSNLENSPGNVVRTFDEVIMLLKNKKFDIDKVKKFKEENILIQDSKACDRLLKYLFNK